MGMTETVRITAKPQVDEYDVVIEPGCLGRLGDHVARHAPAHAYAIISDSNVSPLYAERASDALAKSGARVMALEFPAGERNKNSKSWESLIDVLTETGFGRDSCVIALGGGVTSDLAGFVAATFMRGVPVVQVPTTLLAMIDASIGGKTGLDSAHGKNLLGVYHHPRLVLVDPQLLQTLPEHELQYGLAEAVKHGAIADAEYLTWIVKSSRAIFNHKIDAVTSLIARSVRIKAGFVSDDVREAGVRAVLNFGHTIGHALEYVANYDMPHGQAVGLGMLVEATAGELAGITEAGTADKLREALVGVRLQVSLSPAIKASSVLAATRTDKKTRAGEVYYTLPARLGAVARTSDGGWTMPLPDDVVREALKRVSAQR